ncbi:MAG: hypothetical protein WBM48_04495 [Polyangiales bacterium]|jgi:hypothetical protein
MSSVYVIIATTGVFVGTMFLCVWMFQRVIDIMLSIAFGSYEGVELPGPERMARLLLHWLPYTGALVTIPSAAGVGMLEVANASAGTATIAVLYAYLLFVF